MGLEPYHTERDMILSLVSPLDIFEAFCPKRFTLNKMFSSPLREDKHPSFVISFKRGYYSYNDYTRGNRGDCFDFVKEITGAQDYKEVFNNIDARLGLNLTKDGIVRTVSLRKKLDEELEDVVEEEKLFQVVSKPYDEQFLNYWVSIGVDEAGLKGFSDVEVISVQELWIDKKLRFINSDDQICIAYKFQDKWIKVYRPFADRDKGEWKWLSNVPLNTMYGLDNVKSCDKAIVANSVKDGLVLRMIYPCVCGSQNESLAALSDENMEYLKSNCKEIFINGDADAPGKEFSHTVTKLYEVYHINTPDYLLAFNVNDFGGWAKRDGIEAIRYFLKLKGFLK